MFTKAWVRAICFLYLHYISTSFRVGIYTVNCSEDQFFLQVAELHNIFLGFLYLDLRVSWDDSKTCAWGIEKNSIKILETLGKFPAILANNNLVSDSKTTGLYLVNLESKQVLN